MAKGKKLVDAMMSGVKTPAQMKAEMAVSRVRDVLPKAEREINLGNMLRESTVKDRLYHGTSSDFSEFKYDPQSLGIWMAKNPEFASIYSHYKVSNGNNPNVMPLYSSLKNPATSAQFYKAKELAESEPNISKELINQRSREILQEQGFDGVDMGDAYVAFDPSKVKSAIGNRGTYDTSDPDITKAHGGIIKMGVGGLGKKGTKLLPKVEAPSVMTRSEISELADYIKNREGGYGLRRVERAADEIPRLGEMYTQDALRSAFSGDNARALMTMNPADFEKYSRPLEPMLTTVSGGTGRYDMSTDDYVKYLQSVGGFDDVPYFMINKQQLGTDEIPYIAGHEGRNRSRALSAAGNEAGLVVLNPRAGLREPFPRRSQEDYIEALKKEFSITGNRIRPETYFDNSLQEDIRRPAIDMPDLYAKGGAVKMKDGGDPEREFYDQLREQFSVKNKPDETYRTPYDSDVHNRTTQRFDSYRQTKENPDTAPTLDQQRLELMNAPVIQATPQTFTQRAIGTLGGYMDQAGDFINKSLEPIAETHPVKHFIGEMFGDSFKSAGTALQDYTKTSRDYTEDNPYKRAPITGSGQTMSLDPRMLDVIGFADPVARLGIKAGKAGVKAATPFAKDVGEMASEMYMRGDISGMPSPNMYAVSPDGKPSKVLAPASDIGFYSPTEAAALNLQRKSGSGQAFLNDIMKGENVKSDEISAMGLDTFLKDKKNVTAEEVRDYIAQNKIQLGESRYTDELDVQAHDRAKKAFQDYSRELGDKYGINPHQNISMYATMKGIPKEEIARYEELQHNWLMTKQPSTTKYASYALPGGENYREIVLTLEPKPISEAEARSVAGEAAWNVMSQEQRAKFMSGTRESDKRNAYKSSHWDEPNPLAHLRVSDRVTDGKKTLLVDEVQSDWHQAGREKGYDIKPTPEELERISQLEQKSATGNISMSERAEWAGLINKREGTIPNAPFKDDWYQLTLRRAIKEAIDGGYDRVALPTGSRVAERFDLSKQIDRIDYNKNDDGTYSMSAIKNGKQVFSKEDLDENELSGIVGKDVAKKMVGDEGAAQYDADIADELGVGVVKSLTGLDLSVGGKGMKKYYDEIYPSYLKKFGKKYGANVGSTRVEIPPKSSGEVLKYDGGQEYANGQITWKEFLQRNPQAAKDFTEPLHYMEITPAMRKEFSTGIHMKSGGKVQFAKSLDAMRHELTKAK